MLDFGNSQLGAASWESTHDVDRAVLEHDAVQVLLCEGGDVRRSLDVEVVGRVAGALFGFRDDVRLQDDVGEKLQHRDEAVEPVVVGRQRGHVQVVVPQDDVAYDTPRSDNGPVLGRVFGDKPVTVFLAGAEEYPVLVVEGLEEFTSLILRFLLVQHRAEVESDAVDVVLDSNEGAEMLEVLLADGGIIRLGGIGVATVVVVEVPLVPYRVPIPGGRPRSVIVVLH